MSKNQRRQFSREFKLEAVQLANQEGVPVAQVARNLGVRDSVLRRWMKQYEEKGEQAFGGSGRIAPKDQETGWTEAGTGARKTENGIFSKARRCSSPKIHNEIPVYGGVSSGVSDRRSGSLPVAGGDRATRTGLQMHGMPFRLPNSAENFSAASISRSLPRPGSSAESPTAMYLSYETRDCAAPSSTRE